MTIDKVSWNMAGVTAFCMLILGFKFLAPISGIRPIAWIAGIICALISLVVGFIRDRPRILAPVPLMLFGAFALFGIRAVNSFWPM